MVGFGRIVFGIVCLVFGWAGFELMTEAMARRRELGYDILTGDLAVLLGVAGPGALATLMFAFGITRSWHGIAEAKEWREQASAVPEAQPEGDHPWLKVREWRQRRIVFGTPVRGGIVVLAGIFFGLPGLFFVWLGVTNPPSRSGETIGPVLLLPGAMLFFIVGALAYWWLRKRRYGESICRLLTLPGVAGGRFEADVDCALPPDPDATAIVRLINLVPAGKSYTEVWRMEERIAVPVEGVRTVVKVRLPVPRAKEQRFMSRVRGFKEWLLASGAIWNLEVEKKVPGIDFFARFSVPMCDLPDAPPGLKPLPPVADFPARRVGVQPWPASLACALVFGVAWLGYKVDWPRYLSGPNSDWISGQRFQGEINFWWRHASYPALIEMRCAEGNAQYRSDWKQIPAGARYQAWSGLAPEEFARRDRDYSRSGYVLESSSRFRDCAGRERVSATWLTKGRSP